MRDGTHEPTPGHRGDGSGGASRIMAGETGPGDGRNIDPEMGLLEGEGSQQEVPGDRALVEGTVPYVVWGDLPSRDGEQRVDPTYYDRPVIKKTVWKWYIPAYLYVGGAAGAAAALAGAAQIVDRRGLDGLIRRARWIATAGSGVGTVLLILDLGRPARFLNMLRVFRPTSPMNVGSWILSALAPAAAGSALLARRTGPGRLLGDAAGLAAGVTGPPLAGYTAVLLSNTAVPVWQQLRRTLPALFVTSAMSSAASLLELMDLTPAEERVVHAFGVAGKAAELAAAVAVDREAGRVERVGAPLREGASGRMWQAAKALTLASLVLSLAPGSGRGRRVAGGLLGMAGGLAVRFGIAKAGDASAMDPRATFHQQRAGLGGAEVTGRAAVAGPR